MLTVGSRTVAFILHMYFAATAGDTACSWLPPPVRSRSKNCSAAASYYMEAAHASVAAVVKRSIEYSFEPVRLDIQHSDGIAGRRMRRMYGSSSSAAIDYDAKPDSQSSPRMSTVCTTSIRHSMGMLMRSLLLESFIFTGSAEFKGMLGKPPSTSPRQPQVVPRAQCQFWDT